MSRYRVSIGHPCIDVEEVRAALECLAAKRLTQGLYVQGFEHAWCERLGRAYAVAANSGSSANLLALAAMKERYGWKQGSVVLVPACTFATAVTPVIQLGLWPVFVDVDATGNLSYASLQELKYLGDVVALVLVHSLGQAAQYTDSILVWCRDHGIKVLEDCCESHAARYDAAQGEVGSKGDIATFSFHVAHAMTTGEGGLAVTDDGGLDLLLRSYREFGRHDRQTGWGEQSNALGFYHDAYVFERCGYNLRMTDLEAALGLEQLKKLNDFAARRRELALRLEMGLGALRGGGQPLREADVPYAFLLTSDRRDSLAVFLETKGIETRPFMGGNLLRHPAFARYGRPEAYPNADTLHRHALLVGCHPGITNADADYVVECIKKFYET